MTRLVTAPLSSKAQITLPKAVRELLGIQSKGDLVGFILDSEERRVQLTRVESIPVQEDFTSEEYKKLLLLPQKEGGKTFRSMQSLIKELKQP